MLRDLVGLGCRVVVWDPAAASRADALALGAAAAVESLDDAEPADGAIVASPTLTHESAVSAILRRGVPVFCEKPLTADSDSARELARRGSGRLFTMDKWRYHPAIEFLGDLARSGAAGSIRELATTRIQPRIDGYDVDAVWLLAPHEVSIGREILGSIPAPTAASGELRAGGQGWLEAHFRDDVAWSFRVSSVAPRRARTLEAKFDAEVCSWTIDDEFSVRITRGAVVETVPLKPFAPLARELEAFVAFLGGGPVPKSSAAEGAETVALVESLRRMAGLAS